MEIEADSATEAIQKLQESEGCDIEIEESVQSQL
jgi:hypothetical protein